MQSTDTLTHRPALAGLLLSLALLMAACAPAGAGQSYAYAPLPAPSQAAPAPLYPTNASAPTAVPPSATAAAPTATPVVMNSGLVQSATSPQFGVILVTADGRTLYTNTFDSAGASKCVDNGCTSFWLPYIASGQPVAGPGVPGSLGTLTRPDGSLQVTYNQKPLYTFYADKPGDITGNGLSDMGGTWHVALASPASTSNNSNSGAAGYGNGMGSGGYGNGAGSGGYGGSGGSSGGGYGGYGSP